MSEKFRTFAQNKQNIKDMNTILGVQETKLDNCKVVSCGLTNEQHETAVEMYKNNPFDLMHYDLKKVEDREMVNVWIADAHSEGNEEYAEFLRKALAEDADLYTFKYGWQEIGEVAIYNR